MLACVALGCGGRTSTDDYFNAATAGDDAAVGAPDTAPGDAPVGLDAEPPVVPDSGTVTPEPPIACGMTSCDPASQECCIRRAPGGTSQSCVPRGSCERGVALSCSASSCASGQVCCLRVRMDGAAATCTPMCSGRGAFRLCTSDAECPMGQRCRATELGVRACLGFGG